MADGFGLNHTFDRIFANYWKHPEFKRLAPDGTGSVEISLTLTEKQAVLIVRDFGHGMAADLMESSDLNDNHFGVGLSGMRERVADLGGTFAIESNPQGTAVMVALPLTPPPSAKAGSPPSKKISVA